MVCGDICGLPCRLRPVRAMQQRLLSLSRVYDSIPAVAVDGVFGTATASAVRAFQREFGLEESGRIDLITWETIVLAEDELGRLMSGRGEMNLGVPDGCVMLLGPQNSENVENNIDAEDINGSRCDMANSAAVTALLQVIIGEFALRYRNFRPLLVSGVYDAATATQVAEFQRLAGLAGGGVLNRPTWNLMLRLFDNI